jgi:hypothetical protein
MTRPAAIQIGRLTPPQEQLLGFRFESIGDQDLPVGDVTAGMVTTASREKTPPGAAQLVKNGRVRDKWVGRREGTAQYVAKPNSTAVRKIVTFYDSAGDRVVVRIASGSIHVSYTNDAWANISLGGLNLPDARYDVDQFLDNLVIADGRERLRYLRASDVEIQELPDSPVARYVANYGDRIVAAYIAEVTGGVIRTGIRWCANADPFQWNAVDEDGEITGAGQENLAGSVTDFGDGITGLVPLGALLCIPRERSIWVGTRQPIQAAPFRFQQLVSGQGCDLPYTTVRVFQNSIIYADWSTNGVWFYTPGSEPVEISGPIRDELFAGLEDGYWAEGAWDDNLKEYHLGLTTTDGSALLQKTWVWNAVTQAWEYDDLVVSTVGAVAVPRSQTSIDELTGTIDALTGTIDDLGIQSQQPIRFMAGTGTGEVIVYDFAYDTDYNSNAFEFLWESHDIGPAGRRATLKRILAILQNGGAVGDVTIESSIDGVTWGNAETASLGATAGWLKRGWGRIETGDHLHWRLRATASGVRMYEYWLRILTKFEQHLG